MVVFMSSKFYEDLKKAKVGEEIVLDVLKNATNEWIFTNVSEDEEYYYKGDIEAWNIDVGCLYIDVKMDSRIAQTGNVLCEKKVYSYKDKKYHKGNLDSDYDDLAIISVEAKKIWIIDFNVLKKHYKEGRAYSKDHYDNNGNLSQKTIGTLCSLKQIKKWGGLLYEIEYDDNHKIA